MPHFHYKAIQSNGTTTEGDLEAGGRQEAFRQMAERGLRPINLTESASAPTKNGKPAKSSKSAAVPVPASTPDTASASTPASESTKLSFSFGSGKVTPKMLENFTRLLSSLLAAGVPLSRALVILCKEAAAPAAAAKWKTVYDRVVDGMSLADAMATCPETFPRVYIAMVQAGETGGFLDPVLAQIADFQSREKELKSKVTTALLYPAILMILATGVLIFLMIFFIPRFQMIFAGFGGKLPALTQVIIGISNAMRSYGWLILLALAIVGLMARNWFVSDQGRRTWEKIMLKAPIIGPLVGQFAMARFCRMLGTLLAAGVPLVQGLNVARRSIGNQILVDAVESSIEQVKEGGQLGASLAQCKGLFAGSIVEMISVAEESGKLDQELVRIATVTENDLDRELKTAVAIAEPLLLFVVAGLIGTIFIGMMLPIFTLQDYIK